MSGLKKEEKETKNIKILVQFCNVVLGAIEEDLELQRKTIKGADNDNNNVDVDDLVRSQKIQNERIRHGLLVAALKQVEEAVNKNGGGGGASAS